MECGDVTSHPLHPPLERMVAMQSIIHPLRTPPKGGPKGAKWLSASPLPEGEQMTPFRAPFGPHLGPHLDPH
jgi:hypothetical protein